MIPPLPPFPAMCVFCFPFASRMQLRGIPVFLPGPVRHAVLLTPSLSSRLPRPFRNGSPNSLGIISFADHHPLIPLESYRFKTMGARRPSCSSNFQPSTFDFQPPSLSKPFSCNTYGSPRNCWALLTSSAQFSLRGVDKEKVTVFSNEAGGMMAEVGLLPFARVALHVATRILPPYRTRFSKHQFTQPQLLAVLCLMRFEDWTFREAEVRLREHQELRAVLQLPAVPDYTTLYRFLRRLEDVTVD